MKLLGIVRVSTLGQAGDSGDGLQRQRDSIQQIAADWGAEVEIIEIEGVSGAHLRLTPEWCDRVVPALSRDPDTHIAVDSIDRLIRASSMDYGILGEIQRLAKRIYLPGRQIRDLAQSSDDALITVIAAAIAGREKAEIKRRGMAGKEARRKLGHWVAGLLPPGIRWDKKTASWSHGPQHEVEMIQRIFRDYAAGRTLDAIGTEVGRQSSTLLQWMRNDLYRGWLVFDERRKPSSGPGPDGRQARSTVIPRPESEVIRVQIMGGQGQPPAIIDADLWSRVQTMAREAAGRHTTSRAASREVGWLTGRMVAGSRPLPEIWSTDEDPIEIHRIYCCNFGDSVHYVCRCRMPKYATGGRCKTGEPLATLINTAVDRYLHDFTRDPDIAGQIVVAAERGTNDDGERRQRLQDRVNELLAQRQRAQRLVIRGLASEDDVADEIRDIKRQQDAAVAALAALDKPNAPTPDEIRDEIAGWTWHADWSAAQKTAWLRHHNAVISITRTGVESLTIRFHSRSQPAHTLGGMVWSGGGLRTWRELLGEGARLPYSDGVMGTEMAKRLGISSSRLRGLLRSKIVPEPTGTYSSSMRCWLPDEADAVEAAYRRYKGK